MTLAQLTGVGMTPFGRHADRPIVDLAIEAARLALTDAGIAYDEVDEVFGASMMAPPGTALDLAHGLGRSGIPATGIESASAGGLVALRHAVRAVASGDCDVALAVGYEKLTALEPGGVVPAPRTLWDRFPPQLQFAIEANQWLEGTDHGPEVFAAVAAKAHNLAAQHPLAARRLDHEVTIDEVLESRMVATPLTRMMCHTPTDGAAAIVVTRDALARSVPLLAIEQTTKPEDRSWPEVGTAVGSSAQTASTSDAAFRRAGLAPADVGVVQLHDMCASEELLTLVALGLATKDEVIELALGGGLGADGRLPTNTDGGCIARGHPIGATGLGQAIEVVRQLRGEALGAAVAAPRHGLVQTVGGGGSCVVALLGAG